MSPDLGSRRTPRALTYHRTRRIRLYSRSVRRGLPVALLGFPVPFGREMAMLAEWIALAPGDRVLSLTCGPGDVERGLARRCPRARFHGVDLSAEALGIAAGRRGRAAIDLVRADVYALPFASHTFAKVLCCGGLHLLPTLEHALYELHRVCCPGARVVGQTLCVPDSAWRIPFALCGVRSPAHASDYARAFVACGFDVVRWRHVRACLHFGLVVRPVTTGESVGRTLVHRC